jgi:hypothetical protein
VLTGSLNIPAETRSHHLDASPIKFAASSDCINPRKLNNINIAKNAADIIDAR